MQKSKITWGGGHNSLASSSKSAFTLAEVLITLAIIGVVAALTIPSVILNTNQTEYKSALKKAVSVLNQATSLRLATENDSPSSITSENALMTMLGAQMNTVQNNVPANCTAWTDLNANAVANGQALTSGTSPATNTVCYFTTTDGMQFWLANDVALDAAGLPRTCKCTKSGNDACPNSLAGYTEENCSTPEGKDYTLSWAQPNMPDYSKGCTSSNVCYLVVDVNGDKNPNKFTTGTTAGGNLNIQDRFILSIEGTTISPVGGGQDTMYNN